jgi:hypothetical protein
MISEIDIPTNESFLTTLVLPKSFGELGEGDAEE